MPEWLSVAQQLINGVMIGSVYALFALGFTLVFGVLNVLNLAHGAVFMWGAFVGLYVVDNLALPIWLAFVIAISLGALLGLLVDLVAFRPLRKRKGDEFSGLISSLGANLILISIAQQLTRSKIMSFPYDVFPTEIYRAFGLRISFMQLTLFGGTLVLLALMLFAVFRTPWGARLRAVAVSERTASLVGINPNAVYVQTFLLAGALASATGVMMGITFNSIHFLMGEPIMLRAFVVIVLGGMGSIAGALVGGLLVGIIEALSVGFISSQLSDAILFATLFVVLLLYPTGMFSGLRNEARVARVMRQ